MSVCTPRPVIESGLLDSWFEGWAITLSGVADGWATALQRGPWSLDLPRWAELATTRRPPRWSTPNEVVFEGPIARLRDFSSSSRRAVVPTLVLPPQAGHDSCIVDYSEQQSQMRTIVSAGLTQAYTIDWRGATPETADASIEDYLAVIDCAVE